TTDIFAGTFSAGNRTKVSDEARESLATKLVTPTLADPNKMQVERIEGVITNSRGADLKGHFHNANAQNGSVNTDKVVLFLSGSGGSCEDYSKDIANKYTEKGVSVMAVNYRGFSDNAGIPSENGLYKDARAMFNYLTTPEPNGRGIAPQNVIIHGFSLGGPVAANLVKELKNEAVPINVKGLVLDRPMASMKGAVIGSTGSSIAASLSKKYVGSFDIEKKLNTLPNRDIPIVLTTDRDFLHDVGENLRTKARDMGFNVVGQTYDVEHEDSASLMDKVSYWNNISNTLLT
ncbi:MAG: alpha/beta hydrolase, partial [Candidatus Sericytochromatia bacterium]